MEQKTKYEVPRVLQEVECLLESDLLGDSQNVPVPGSSITTEGQYRRDETASDAFWD